MKKTLLRILSAAFLLALIFTTPVYAKAKTTSIVPGFKMSLKKGAYHWNSNMKIVLDAETKIGSGNPSISMTLLLPKQLLAKNNVFEVLPQLDLHDPSIKNGDDFFGSVPGKYTISVSVDNSGKIKLERRIGKSGTLVKLGGFASIKKSGDFYVLTIKKLPFDKIYFRGNEAWTDENEKPLIRTKKFYYSVKIEFRSIGDDRLANKVSAWCYVDKLSIKVAKTLKLSMVDWNFRWIDTWCWVNDKEQKRPARRLAQISY